MRGRHLLARIGLAATAGLALVGMLASMSLDWPLGPSAAVYGSISFVFAAVGWLIVERRPGNGIGPVLLLFGVAFSTYVPLDALLRVAPASTGTAAIAAFLQSLDVPTFALLALALIYFPDGQVPSDRWRFAAPVAVVVIVAGTIGVWSWSEPIILFPAYRSPLGIEGFPAPAFIGAGYLGMLFLFGAAILSLIVRWRRGTGLDRTQIKWIAAAATVALAVEFANVATFSPDDPNSVIAFAASFALALIPVAIGIAILRYRLYEIDRIISRTIAYAVVTGVLATVFVGLVLLLQTVLTAFTGGTTIAVAGSTLAVFALFQPVLRRVRRTVDRRFDRARYDAERTATAFSERLRDEVDLTTVTADLSGTTSRSLAPSSIGIWIRTREPGR